MNKLKLTPAATVLILRDSQDGMEVLMVKRSKRPPFGNLFVFPGGKIDDDDSSQEIADLCEGITDKEASLKLGLASGGLAYWVACIRECFEEVGILLARKRNGDDLELDVQEKEKYKNYRERLLKNEINLYEILKREDLILTTSNLAPFSHWITPEIEERRFDTRFFLAKVNAKQLASHDGFELTESFWIKPVEALNKLKNGEINMILPTIKNIEKLAEFSSSTEAFSYFDGLGDNAIPPILPKFIKRDGEWVGFLPGEEGYDNV